MSGRVLRFDDPEHEAVEALLPWFVNGTLDVDECSLVERHLKDCTRCGHEADSLRQLKTAYGESGMVPDAAQSLHKLRRKLDKPRARRLLPRLFDLTRFGRQSWLWVQWVVAGELAVILVLGMLLVFSGRPTTLYQTLGAADVPRHVAGSLVVVFDPRITEEELRRIVQMLARALWTVRPALAPMCSNCRPKGRLRRWTLCGPSAPCCWLSG